MILAVRKGAKKKLSTNFNSFELDCKCINDTCTFTLYSPQLLELLEKLRGVNEGRPLHIDSGFRCAIHNKGVGGRYNSQHLVGLAVDIRKPVYLPFKEFENRIKLTGFNFILPYHDEEFIHVDLRTGGF